LEALEYRAMPSTFTVTTTVDGGLGSLRQAILDANASPGADTINVPAGSYQLTLGELQITDDLTIIGNNVPGSTVIDAGLQSRIFEVFGVNANFSWLTMQNGLADHGGGILNDGGAMSVSHCGLGGIQVNYAISNTNGSDASGGGIYSTGGSMAVSDSVFRNFSQPSASSNGEGGDIYATNCQVSIARSTFEGLTFGGPSGNAQGGSIYIANSTLTIADCTFSGNFAAGGGGAVAGDAQGGGIYATGSTISISASQMLDENAFGGFGGYFTNGSRIFTKDGDTQGGAIYLASSTLTFSNSELINNGTGSNGGSGSGLGDNAQGGGIFALNSSLTVVNSTLSGLATMSDGPLNVPVYSQGGAIYAAGSTVSVVNSNLTGNQALGGSAAQGGGIYVDAATITTVSNSSSSDIYNAGTLTINHSGVGGLVNFGSATLRNSRVAPIANFGTLTVLHSSAGVTTGTASGTGSDPGALLPGNINLYVDNSNGDLTPDELARIQDAVTAVDAVTQPYGAMVTEVTDPTLADVTLNMDATSAVGGYADGVLGCTTDLGQITIIAGWNIYAGSDPTQIGSGQYDFETVVTHELGHALGLGHSANSASVMFATLNPGMANRTLTVADLNVPDSDTTGACGLHAAPVGRISNPSYGIDLVELATAGLADVGQHSNDAVSTASQDWNPDPQAAQVGRISNPSYWDLSRDFTGRMSSSLKDGNSLFNSLAGATTDQQDEFWSTAGGTPWLGVTETRWKSPI
jgi:hypothetical protein